MLYSGDLQMTDLKTLKDLLDELKAVRDKVEGVIYKLNALDVKLQGEKEVNNDVKRKK